jgi:acetylornithine deacetylase/succinyl-diaminopimelate desuccinylase-like protein
LLYNLVEIPSVTGDEGDICSFVRDTLNEIGMDVTLFGHNVLGKFGSGSPSLMLCGHLDTVPPYVPPRIRACKLYGRGAADDKGGIAAVIDAISKCDKQLVSGTLLALFVVDEENNSTGIDEAIPHLRADFSVVCEPTNLEIVNGHKGRIVLKIESIGKTAHTSQPQMGRNAIVEMAHVITKLEDFPMSIHPILGRETLTVSQIKGGIADNVIPDHCVIEVEYRHVPPNNSFNIITSLRTFLPEVKISFIKDPERFTNPFYLPEHLIIEELKGALTDVGAKSNVTTMDACTDASRLNAAGIPSIVFGPGLIEQAHTSNEWVALKQVKSASRIFKRLIERILLDTR